MKIKLVQTCSACPEQYDAFLGDELVGYLRLRFGNFTVQCPDVGGTLVYSRSIGDNGWDGAFFDELEQYKELRKAKKSIKKWIRKHR